MKIKRITTRDDYFEQILGLDIDYAPHAKETCEGFRDDLEVSLHNPYMWLFALINSEDMVRGFCLACVVSNVRAKHIQIEKFFCRDADVNVAFFRKVRTVLCTKFGIEQTEVFMNTRRNPAAWQRFMRSRGLDVEPVAYLLRFTDKE